MLGRSTKIMKSVATLNGHNFGSLWARDSSKKAFYSSWLALSNGMESDGSAGRAVHVQDDWKLSRAPRDEKRFSSRGSGEFVFYAKNCTRVQKISEIEETFVNNWVVR